jgi:Flp pilus assembly protein TadB
MQMTVATQIPGHHPLVTGVQDNSFFGGKPMDMKSNHLIIFTIICAIVLVYGAITFQWLVSCIIIALLILTGLIFYLNGILVSIQQNLEKIEQHLDVIRKSRP